MKPTKGNVSRTTHDPRTTQTEISADQYGDGFHELRIGIRPSERYKARFNTETVDIDLRDIPAVGYKIDGVRVLIAVLDSNDLLETGGELIRLAIDHGADPVFLKVLTEEILNG